MQHNWSQQEILYRLKQVGRWFMHVLQLRILHGTLLQ